MTEVRTAIAVASHPTTPSAGIEASSVLVGVSAAIERLRARLLHEVVSDDPILSLTWQADLGGVRNTGIDDIRVSEHAVPEPGTLILLGSGLAGAAFRRRRRSPTA